MECHLVWCSIGIQVNVPILPDSTGCIRNQAENEFYILSLNRWAVRENNQSLENLLRTCVLDHLGIWDEILSLVEFSYNNSYHASI